MWKRRSFLAIVTRSVAFFVTASVVLESSSLGRTVAGGNYESTSSVPTSVSGQSWLTHLGRSFDETSMGKTGQLGPPTATPQAELVRWQMGLAPEPANEIVTLHGSDLYRMNCRGCHGEQGLGAPPEINSVINPVRATSAAAVMERMRAVGMDIRRADAAKLAQQSKGMLLERLHHGGQDMPAFPHLGEAEVNSLVAYLRQLAGIRGAQAEQVAVREPRVRVGEHIVKSTCHICHSAAGPNPDPQQLYEGAIPPLNTLALRTSRAEFIRKVTHGAPVVMGAPPDLYRGTMPVFYYLSEDEAADVYLYLARYPSYQWATLDANQIPTSAASPQDHSTVEPMQPVIGASFEGASFVANGGLAKVRPATTNADARITALAVLSALVAILFLGVGFGFTVYELKKLSTMNEDRDRGVGRVGEDAGAEGEGGQHASECADRELVACPAETRQAASLL